MPIFLRHEKTRMANDHPGKEHMSCCKVQKPVSCDTYASHLRP